MYGLEGGQLSQAHLKELDVFQRKKPRKILGVSSTYDQMLKQQAKTNK